MLFGINQNYRTSLGKLLDSLPYARIGSNFAFSSKTEKFARTLEIGGIRTWSASLPKFYIVTVAEVITSTE
jgi:hypothetical protein